jgi:hypothetical protein
MPRGRPRKSSEDVLLKSAEMIGWALGGLEREIAATRDRLAALSAQATKLRARLGKAGAAGRAAASGDESGGGLRSRVRRRRKMSAEARKRISEMMKKRWAERRKRTA